MISNIKTVRNTSGSGYPQWIEWNHNGMDNSVEVETIKEKEALFVLLVKMQSAPPHTTRPRIRYIRAKRC